MFCFHLSQLLDGKIHYNARSSTGYDIAYLLWDVTQLTLLGAVVLNIRLPLSVYFASIYYGNVAGVSYKIMLTEHTEEFRDEVEHKNVDIDLYSYNHTYRGRSEVIYNLHRRTTIYFKYCLCRICNCIFLPSAYDALSS